MATRDIIRLTAAELAEALTAGEITSVEATQAYLDRIAEIDGEVHAYLHVNTEEALATAADVDARRTAGEELGPLAGVPVAVKDVVVTKGQATTAGSKILQGWIPPYDATLVGKAARRGDADPGQDQHGRVRHGVQYRALGLRPHLQPVGHRPYPRWLRWRLGRSRGRLRGAAGNRYRHRRIHPPARRRHRHRGRQAHLRFHLPVRPDRPGLQLGPGGPLLAHGARFRIAARPDQGP